MDGPIAVVNANKEECEEVCALLERNHFQAIPFFSLESLEEFIKENRCQVAILDFDSLPVNNRLIGDLKREHPELPIMGLSSRPFHPELEEAMSTKICACIGKPPDAEELIYCIKSFCEM